MRKQSWFQRWEKGDQIAGMTEISLISESSLDIMSLDIWACIYPTIIMISIFFKDKTIF